MTPTGFAAASSVCGSEMCDNQPCQTPVREYTPFLCLYAFLLCCGASVSINTLARLVLLRSQRSGPPAGLEGAGIASGARDVRFLAAALDAGSPHRRAEQTQTGPSRALSPRPARSGRFRRRATSRGHRGDTTRRRTESRGHRGDHSLAHGPATPSRPRRRRPAVQSPCCARCTSPRSHR